MLLDGGARVLVTDRSQAGLESAQKELGNGGFVVSSDARSLTNIDALVSRVKDEFDTFDMLFVNAGFGAFGPFESPTESIRDEMLNLNAKGPFRGAKAHATDQSGRRCRPHDLDRERQRHAASPRKEAPGLRCDPSPGCLPSGFYPGKSASTR